MQIISKIRRLLAIAKFMAGRGQQYVSLGFWSFTISQLFLMNLRNYMVLSFLEYCGLLVVTIIFIFVGVLTIGYVDKQCQILSTEQGFQHENSPVLAEILDNTRQIKNTLEDEHGRC
jgi:hypothetical protein